MRTAAVLTFLVMATTVARAQLVLYDSERYGGLESGDWILENVMGEPGGSDIVFADGIAVIDGEGGGYMSIAGAEEWEAYTTTIVVEFSGYREAPFDPHFIEVREAGGSGCSLHFNLATAPIVGGGVVLYGENSTGICDDAEDVRGRWCLQFGPDLQSSESRVTARAWRPGEAIPAWCESAVGTISGRLRILLYSQGAGTLSIVSVRIEGASGVVPVSNASWSSVRALYR